MARARLRPSSPKETATQACALQPPPAGRRPSRASAEAALSSARPLHRGEPRTGALLTWVPPSGHMAAGDHVSVRLASSPLAPQEHMWRGGCPVKAHSKDHFSLGEQARLLTHEHSQPEGAFVNSSLLSQINYQQHRKRRVAAAEPSSGETSKDKSVPEQGLRRTSHGLQKRPRPSSHKASASVLSTHEKSLEKTVIYYHSRPHAVTLWQRK